MLVTRNFSLKHILYSFKDHYHHDSNIHFEFMILFGGLSHKHKQMFLGVYWNQPVCLSTYVSVCVPNTNFCQSTGGYVKSHLVTVLVIPPQNECLLGCTGITMSVRPCVRQCTKHYFLSKCLRGYQCIE